MNVDSRDRLAHRFDVCQYGVVTSTMTSPSCSGTTPAGLTRDQAQRIAATLKALADPVRLQLYSRIAAAGQPVCVCDIQDVGVAQPTVSHHLRKLRQAGLIDCERRGTWVYYWISSNHPALLHALAD